MRQSLLKSCKQIVQYSIESFDEKKTERSYLLRCMLTTDTAPVLAVTSKLHDYI